MNWIKTTFDVGATFFRIMFPTHLSRLEKIVKELVPLEGTPYYVRKHKGICDNTFELDFDETGAVTHGEIDAVKLRGDLISYIAYCRLYGMELRGDGNGNRLTPRLGRYSLVQAASLALQISLPEAANLLLPQNYPGITPALILERITELEQKYGY